jgi:GntR family galactonate operon transcriptional repressor
MTKIRRLTELFGKQIAQGAFAPGGALPSEAELCNRFGASRSMMREIVKVLTAKRLIDAQPHRGLFVMPRERWNYIDADVLEWVLEKGANPALISALTEVRTLIEPMIARWAADRSTAADLAAIEIGYGEMAANRTNFVAFNEADIRFHHAILEASHNVVIQQLADVISALFRAIFDFTFMADSEHIELTLREHFALLDAIRRRDTEAAESVCREMVERTARRVQKA